MCMTVISWKLRCKRSWAAGWLPWSAGADALLVGQLFSGFPMGEKHPTVGTKMCFTEVSAEVSCPSGWGAAVPTVSLSSESRIWSQSEEDEWKAKNTLALCFSTQASPCDNLTWKKKRSTSIPKNNSSELNHKQSHREKAGTVKGNASIMKLRYSSDIGEVVFSANKPLSPWSHIPLWKQAALSHGSVILEFSLFCSVLFVSVVPSQFFQKGH